MGSAHENAIEIYSLEGYAESKQKCQFNIKVPHTPGNVSRIQKSLYWTPPNKTSATSLCNKNSTCSVHLATTSFPFQTTSSPLTHTDHNLPKAEVDQYYKWAYPSCFGRMMVRDTSQNVLRGWRGKNSRKRREHRRFFSTTKNQLCKKNLHSWQAVLASRKSSLKIHNKF